MKNLFRTKNILAFLLLVLVGAFVAMQFGSFIGFIPASGMMLGGIALTDLDHDEDINNMAGIATIVYVAKTKDIATWPTLNSNPVLPEDTVVLLDSFKMKAGKYFHTFYSTQELGEFKSDIAGPRDGEYFAVTGNFFYPNTNPRALGISNIFKNADVVIIMKEFAGGGQMRVIGSQDLPARIKPSEASGKAFSDQKGITFAIEASSPTLPLVYNGSIATEPGAINEKVTLAVDQTSIDGSLGSVFEVNSAQASDLTITAYSNCEAGSVYRIQKGDFAGALDLILAYGGSFTVTTFADLLFIEDNQPIVINQA